MDEYEGWWDQDSSENDTTLITETTLTIGWLS